jgi:hypothetical protein
MHITKNPTYPTLLTLVIVNRHIRNDNEVGVLPLEAHERLDLPYPLSAS